MTAYCPVAAFGCVPPSAGFPKYDQAGAKKLLADAGYASGFTVDVIYSIANGAGFANMMQAFISAWKAVGITVTPKALDPATWLKTFSTVNPDGTHGWNMDIQPNQTITGDADYTIYRYTTARQPVSGTATTISTRSPRRPSRSPTRMPD